MKKNYLKILSFIIFSLFFFACKNNIKIVDLERIEIEQPPYKLNYYVGEDFESDGLIVYGYYSDGSVTDVTNYVTLTGFSSKVKQEKQIITVSYSGFKTFFNVNIISNKLEKISIKSVPAKKEYFLYEKIDLAGLSIIAEYDDKTTEDITNSKDLVISGFDSTTAGKKTVTITYKGKTVSFEITVKETQLQSITIESEPSKKDYFTDDIIDFTGMVVKAEYDDGSEIDVTDMVEISGKKQTKVIDVYKPLSTDGKIKITVTYGSETDDFDINVEINYVKTLTVIKSPFKDSYYPMEMVEIGDFEILAEYLNGKKETIKEKNPNLIIKFENKKAIKCDIGTNTIVIQYKTQTTSVTFEVIEDAVTKLEILNEPKQKTFGKNQIISAYGLKLKVTYNSGKTDEVSTGWSISEDSFSTSGNKTVTVTYGGQSIKYEITVTDVYQFHDVITKVGNVYYFGDFPQTSYTVEDNDTIFPDRFVEKGSVTKGNFKYRLGTDNNYYYFPDDGINCYKVEPIKWRCIDENYNGGKLLLCENVISASSTKLFTNLENNKNYSESDIRNLLNGYGSFTNKGFNSVAFGNTTPDELMKTKISLPDGNYVEDEMFILSTSEVINSVSETPPRINPNKFNNIVSTNFADAFVLPNEYTGTENPCIGGWFLRPDKKYDDTYFVAIKFNDRSIDTNKIYPVTDDYFSVCGICPAIVVNSPTVK